MTTAGLAQPMRVPHELDRRDGPRAFLAGLLIAGWILACMALGSVPLTMVGCLAAIGTALIWPMAGLMIFALLAALQMPLVLPLPGLHALLVTSTLVGALFRLPIERPRLSLGAPLLALLGFAAYVVVQQLPDMLDGYVGPIGHEVGFQIIQLLTVVIGAIAAAVVLRGRSPFPLLAALLISACLATTLAIVTFDGVPEGLIARLMAHPDDDAVRASGAFGNPNYYGMFVATSVVLAVGWFVHESARWSRMVLLGVVALLSVGIALSQSRAALVALSAGLVVMAFTRGRRTGVIALAVGIVMLLVAFPLYLEWRLTNLTGSASPLAYAATAQSDANRLHALLAGPGIFLSSPIIGVGFAHYRSLAGLEAHNWYMTVIAELGLVGIGLWLLVLTTVGSAIRHRAPIARTIGFGLLAVTVVGSLFLEPPISIQTSTLTVLSLTAVLVADWSRRRSEAPAVARHRPRHLVLRTEAG